MRIIIAALGCCIAFGAMGQDTASILPARPPEKTEIKDGKEPSHLFYAPRLINANTVFMLPKGILEFKVSHNFNDIAGDFGGIKNFFGLDDALDIRIGFQYGLSKRLNLSFARYKGEAQVQKMYELGLKWLILQQFENDPSHPISMAVYANAVVATMKSGTNPANENFVNGFSDRLSNLYQLMLAKKMGPITLQITPSIVHRNHKLAYDQSTVAALSGAARIHLHGRYSLLLDYNHSFHRQSVVDSFQTRNIKFRDAIGVGFEILTEGHVFQLNFTNATDILENRYIPRTVRSWGKGQFRWGFTIARDFDLLYKKKRKK
ncbi:MAG: DUF5777 family beta-barrel protein [Chitinophagaceae bacterium]